VFQKFELSLKNSENFDAKEFLEMPLRNTKPTIIQKIKLYKNEMAINFNITSPSFWP